MWTRCTVEMRVIADAIPVRLLDNAVIVVHAAPEMFDGGARPQPQEKAAA